MTKEELYLEVAKSWNLEDKKTIAERLGVSSGRISIIARYIQKRTGLKMRRQNNAYQNFYTPELIEKLKQAYR